MGGLSFFDATKRSSPAGDARHARGQSLLLSLQAGNPASFFVQITVKTNFGAVQALLSNSEKQARFAAAVALTKTAKIAEGDVKESMRRVFDRPTRWAINATRVIPATKQTLRSQVWLKDRRGQPQGKDANFLFPQVFGGPRGRKAYETRLLRVGWLRSNEFTVPAKDLALDEYGNVPTGLIRSILSQAKAADGLGYSSNKTQSRRSKATVQKVGTFFVSRGRSTGNALPRGIYQRIRLGSGWGTRLIFAIVEGKPRYRPLLPFADVVRKSVDKNFSSQFDIAYRAAIATAR